MSYKWFQQKALFSVGFTINVHKSLIKSTMIQMIHNWTRVRNGNWSQLCIPITSLSQSMLSSWGIMFLACFSCTNYFFQPVFMHELLLSALSKQIWLLILDAITTRLISMLISLHLCLKDTKRPQLCLVHVFTARFLLPDRFASSYLSFPWKTNFRPWRITIILFAHAWCLPPCFVWDRA